MTRGISRSCAYCRAASRIMRSSSESSSSKRSGSSQRNWASAGLLLGLDRARAVIGSSSLHPSFEAVINVVRAHVDSLEFVVRDALQNDAVTFAGSDGPVVLGQGRPVPQPHKGR